MSALWYIAVFAISALGVYLLTPLSIRIGDQLGLVDEPGGRRKHKGRVVRIGGLGLLPAFAAAALITVPLPRIDSLELTRLFGVLAGMIIVWCMGLLDDRYHWPGWKQLIGLVLAAAVAMICQVFIERFNNPFTDAQVVVDWYIMIPITLVWLVGFPITLNVLDGLDGLVAGVTAISSLILFIHMLRLEQYSVSLLPLALLGCCVGFLPYNFHPAKIFLGGGAYVLGFGLGALSIVAGAKVATALLVLWLPIVDLIWQVYSRWKSGVRATTAGRGHLHLRLQDLGWPQSRIVLMYYGITALLGAAALLISSRLLKFTVLVAAGLLILGLLIYVASKPLKTTEES